MRQISGAPIPLLLATLLLTPASWASESIGEQEIHLPRSLGILEWGAHSAIELHGLEGPVQAWTLSGPLTSEEVTSSVSLRSQSTEPNSGYSLKVSVNWVYLNVSVRDSGNNRSVSSLTRDDFLVYEDDVLQTVEQFEPTEAPFRVLLLLDVSGSTRPYLDLLQRASADFSREIKTNDQIAVATFNSRSWLILPFTSDREKVRTAIDGIYTGGGTALYDALMDSLNDYSDKTHARQAIVVFTDGIDNQLTGNRTEGSRTPFRQLFGEIRDSDSLIYPIFLDHRNHVGRRPRGMLGGLLQNIPRSRRPTIRSGSRTIDIKREDRNVYLQARRQLASIADQTGARFYSPRRIQELESIFSEIADDLRVRYLLAYRVPQPQENRSWRSIRVEIRDHPELVTRTRQGYYSGSAPN